MNSNIKRTYSHFRWLCLLMFGFAAPVLTFGFVKHEVPPQQKILALTDTLYPQIEIQPDSFYLVMKPDTLEIGRAHV